MFDFASQISKFQKDHIRLTDAQIGDMRRRRQTNLERIEQGLRQAEKPEIVETINQGGYAQKTMTQPPEADDETRYDIDLGVVFEDADVASPKTTREWVRTAIASKATNLKYEPENKKKCVRVIYADGYQCDFPVFRRRWQDNEWKYELAAGEDWVASNPSAMNRWIESQVAEKSPEEVGSYQLRRIIRMGKFFAKTQAQKVGAKFPGGLLISALIIEAYIAVRDRDDSSFRETLRHIATRSEFSPVYANGIQISDEKDTGRLQRLINAANEALTELDKLNGRLITEADARRAWKKVFRHSFFDALEAQAFGNASSTIAVGIGAAVLGSQAVAALSDSEKEMRLNAAVNTRIERGGGNKPWAD